MDCEPLSDGDLKELRREITRYPTDLHRRFRLGSALCARQDYGEAIPELQKGMMSPHHRLAAIRLLIAAFDSKGMPEQAAQMRDQLTRESGGESGADSAPLPIPVRPITLGLSRSRKTRR